jgi:methylated-DNA-[protein]-cysteine S-methyltransferase
MGKDCVEIEADLLASAVGEADRRAAGRVGAHLDRCEACRAEFDRYQAIDRGVLALRSREPEPGTLSRSRETLEARLRDLRSRLLLYGVFPSPFGHIAIARSEQGIVLVEYLGRTTSLDRSRLGRLAGADLAEGGRDVEALGREFSEYLEGRRGELRWPVDLRLVRSDFHRRVLEATSTIPPGAVISYSGLAHEVGRPSAVRAVAQALRWNPIPILVPCHRVVGVSGALTGYAGGTTERKQKLLALEGVPLAPIPHDFRVQRERMYVLAPGDSEYCLPSCPSVDLFPRGGLLLGSRERAEAVGLHPCTTCRPDLRPLAS